MFGKELTIYNEVSLAGMFIAKVIDNADPKASERIKVRVLGVHDMDNDIKDNAIWAYHCRPSKSSSGEIPDVNDFVYVTFLNEDPMHCIWHGWVNYIEG